MSCPRRGQGVPVGAEAIFPWIVIDPDCPEWSQSITDDVVDVVGAFREHFNVLIGELDHAAIAERARTGAGHSFALLREALSTSCVIVQGLSLDEPEDVFGGSGVDSVASADHALLAPTRDAARDVAAQRNCMVHTSPQALLGSRNYRTILAEMTRSFAPGSERARLWREVLEPFSRTDIVRVYETYVFKPLTRPRVDIAKTGLHWLLERFSDRARLTPGRRQLLHIRGTYCDAKGFALTESEKQQLGNVERRCRELIKKFEEHLDIRMEITSRAVETSRVLGPHDRFWLGQNANTNSVLRVLHCSNSIVQGAQQRLMAGGAFTVAATSRQTPVNVYTREWSRSTEYIERIVTR